MSLKDDHAKLVRHMATLEAHKREIKSTRTKLQDRAAKQLETHEPVAAAWRKHALQGKGDILTHRRNRTLLTEGSRLSAIVHEREAMTDAS